MCAFNDFNNPQVKILPDHLRKYIIDQRYDQYSPVDQAVWRFVMHQNCSYLTYSNDYLPELKVAILNMQQIPNLQEMNDALKEFGWGAVCVNGLIPPHGSMEFQSHKILAITANIRKLEHISESPLPDIIHDATIYALIISDPEYRQYLNYLGSVGAKSIYSMQDYEFYEANRELCILKEQSYPETISLKKAERKIAICQRNLTDPTEMAVLNRLHYWTVAYGLIGSIENPKIYGAQLLSSPVESQGYLNKGIKILPFTADALHIPFDITKPPTQLFISPGFQNLIQILEDFTDSMAFRCGGSGSLLKAIESKNICTVVYSSGLQVSGVFSDLRMGKDDELQYIKTSGPSALSFENKQLSAHGKTDHAHGFSSPVGRLKNYYKALESATDIELESLSIQINHPAILTFNSGMVLKGIVKSIERRNSKIILISFLDCSVKDEEGNSYFEPSWGIFDMAVGEKINSVYCGAADKESFEEHGLTVENRRLFPEYENKERRYHQLFAWVKSCRETQSGFERLTNIWQELQKDFRADWLCAMEILEILELMDVVTPLAKEIRIHLEMKASNEPELRNLVLQGLHIIQKIQ